MLLPKPKNTLQQKTWNYIRRNPSFRYGDILTIVQISDSSLDRYIRALVQAKYIQRVTSISTRRADSEYEVIKSLKSVAPIMNLEKTKLYDPNTKESFDLRKDEVMECDDYCNQCLRYSHLLGKDYNFLSGYKYRYQHVYPELKTAEEWYEHAKTILERYAVVCEKLRKINVFLSKKGELYSFSKMLYSKEIFTYARSFANGVKHIIKPDRVLMHEDTLKRYESVVVEFETMYGSLDSLGVKK